MALPNIRTTIFLAAVCGQTYVQRDNPDGSYRLPRGFKLVADISAAGKNKQEPFGFIIESRRRIVAAFRGTDSLVDVWHDLKLAQCDFPFVPGSGKTHQGFTDIYAALRQPLMQALGTCGSGKRLLVTGHSLGGALAAYFAFDAAMNARRGTPRVYTFAAPRTGDPVFAAKYNKKIMHHFRVANPLDFLTREPPETIRLPFTGQLAHYRHIGKEFPLALRADNPFGHSIARYFGAVSRLDVEYAQRLCRRNPGFCEVIRKKRGQIGGNALHDRPVPL